MHQDSELLSQIRVRMHVRAHTLAYVCMQASHTANFVGFFCDDFSYSLGVTRLIKIQQVMFNFSAPLFSNGVNTCHKNSTHIKRVKQNISDI